MSWCNRHLRDNGFEHIGHKTREAFNIRFFQSENQKAFLWRYSRNCYTPVFRPSHYSKCNKSCDISATMKRHMCLGQGFPKHPHSTSFLKGNVNDPWLQRSPKCFFVHRPSKHEKPMHSVTRVGASDAIFEPFLINNVWPNTQLLFASRFESLI